MTNENLTQVARRNEQTLNQIAKQYYDEKSFIINKIKRLEQELKNIFNLH